MQQAGTATISFTTSWNTNVEMNPFATGTSSLEADAPDVLEGASVAGGASCGDDDSGGFGYRRAIQVLAAFPGGTLHLVYVLVAPSAFHAGATLPLDWQSAFAVVGLVDPATEAFTQEGMLTPGELHLDAASTVDGEPVSGTITAQFLNDVPVP